MRDQPSAIGLQKTDLCYIIGADICVWIMLALIIAATAKIPYIRSVIQSTMLPRTSLGPQAAVNFFGLLSIILWTPIYGYEDYNDWPQELRTTLWATMTITCLLSIPAFAISCKLILSIRNYNAVYNKNPAPVTNIELEDGQTVNVVENPNFWAAKHCAYLLVVENFGIFGCSLSYIVLMYECSIGIYFE